MKSSIYDKYFVNKEKGIVVSKLSRFGDGRRVTDEMRNELGCFGVSILTSLYNHTDFVDIDDTFEDSFIGVAKCHKTDEFSEKIGKKIADMKAEYKYHSLMQRKYQQIIRHLHKLLRSIENLEREHRNKMVKVDERLKKYM